MNTSNLPITCLILAACFLAMALCQVTLFDDQVEDKVSLTDGQDTITWEYNQELSSKRHPNEGLNVNCKVARKTVPDGSEVHRVVSRSIDDFENDKTRCLEHERNKRQIMFGTVWCGNGHKADDEDHLGYFSDTDSCCRTHDRCDKSLKSKHTKYGVTNDSPYSWSDCECDDAFRSCLQKVDSVISNFVGTLFFDYVQTTKCLDFTASKNRFRARAVFKGTYKDRNGEPGNDNVIISVATKVVDFLGTALTPKKLIEKFLNWWKDE